MSRILIVDDEESIRRSLAGILSDEGFETDSVADGVIPKDQCDKLVIVAGVFIHWEAESDAKIREYNYEATKQAIANAMSGKPTADEMIAGKDTAEHPFKGF